MFIGYTIFCILIGIVVCTCIVCCHIHCQEQQRKQRKRKLKQETKRQRKHRTRGRSRIITKNETNIARATAIIEAHDHHHGKWKMIITIIRPLSDKTDITDIDFSQSTIQKAMYKQAEGV